MKNLIHVSIFGLAAVSLNSCASISNVVDDDVYVVKPSQIPYGESLDDETSYAAYKYKKDKGNNLTRYQGATGFGMGFHTASYAYNPYMYNPYMYHPYGYNPYYPGSWAYMPGHGWTFVLSPYGYGGYNPYYGYNPYGYNHGYFGNYGYYGNTGYWGSPYGYGYGYGGFYGNSGYYGGNGNFWGNTVGSNTGSAYGSNHYSGPRGGSGSGGGVVTRRDVPGTIKSGNISTPVAATAPTFGSLGTAGKSRAVGTETIATNRGGVTANPLKGNASANSPGPSTDSRVTGTSTTLNRPGRVYNTTPNFEDRNGNSSTGRTYNAGSPSRSNGTYQNSGSSTPTRGSATYESTPSRNSAPREYSAPTRSMPSAPSRSPGSSGSGGSRSGGGSTGGGRR